MSNVIYPRETWEWNGMVGHFICGQWCRFHLATTVGPWLVSTVGLYVHPRRSGGSEQTERAYLKKNPFGEDIGVDWKFETMVFRAGKPCDNGVCDCGIPMLDPATELDADRYKTPGAANRGHFAMCDKWSRIPEWNR